MEEVSIIGPDLAKNCFRLTAQQRTARWSSAAN
jgi:hypothetical protein